MFGILYNKTATVYWYSRNTTTKISSYSILKTIKCAVQPLWLKDWVDWGTMFTQMKLYTDDILETWQKVVIDWVPYIVWEVQRRDWLIKKLTKAFISKSDWV